VRQLLLTILVIVSLGAVFTPKAVALNKLNSEQSVAGFKHRAPNAFELSQFSSAPVNNCRPNNPDVSVDSKSFVAVCLEQSRLQKSETGSCLAIKKYLSHIYPSHNFW
jgi:hypothetical protein